MPGVAGPLSGGCPELLTLDLAADYRVSYFGAVTHSPDRLADGNVRTSPNNNLKTLAIVGSLPIEQRCRPVAP
ncbi:MAG: hypothetical protein F4107_05515 [Gemmatimonadetes bacterium]|nr:hypothetical protein [Gemmatimonadota bacterium]